MHTYVSNFAYNCTHVTVQICTEIKCASHVERLQMTLIGWRSATEGGKEVTLWWLKKVGGPKGMGRWEHCWRTLLSVEKPNESGEVGYTCDFLPFLSLTCSIHLSPYNHDTSIFFFHSQTCLFVRTIELLLRARFLAFLKGTEILTT